MKIKKMFENTLFGLFFSVLVGSIFYISFIILVSIPFQSFDIVTIFSEGTPKIFPMIPLISCMMALSFIVGFLEWNSDEETEKK